MVTTTVEGVGRGAFERLDARIQTTGRRLENLIETWQRHKNKTKKLPAVGWLQRGMRERLGEGRVSIMSVSDRQGHDGGSDLLGPERQRHSGGQSRPQRLENLGITP